MQNQCCCSAKVQKSRSVSFISSWSQQMSLLVLPFSCLPHSVCCPQACWVIPCPCCELSGFFKMITLFFFLLFIVVPDYPAAKCISGMSSHQPSRNKSLLHFSFAKAIASSISWDTEIENSFVWDFGLCWHKAAQVFRRAVDVIIQGISFPCCLFIFFFLLVG